MRTSTRIKDIATCCSRATEVFNLNFRFSRLCQIHTLPRDWKTAKRMPLLLLSMIHVYLTFVFNSLFRSFRIRSVSFTINFHLFDHSFDQSICLRPFVYSVKLDFVLRILYTYCILVYLDLLCACMQHDFVLYR